MTVVTFGTSTPELVVNLTAALRGDSAIGFGNVVGANIAHLSDSVLEEFEEQVD